MEKQEKTSNIENRIAAAHQMTSNTSASSTSPKRARQAKGNQKAMKVSDIAVSLLDKKQEKDSKAKLDQQTTEEIVISDDTPQSSEHES